MTAAAQQILRFRGTWSSGASYEAGDVCVTGRWSFHCEVPHVSGQQSQPGHGEHWSRYWAPIDGFGTVAPRQGPLTEPRSADVIPLTGAIAIPAQQSAGPPPPVPADEPRRSLSAPAEGEPPVPALPPRTSEIPDDSDIGMPNLAMALSWIKAMLGQMARKEDLEEDFRELEKRLRGIADRIGAVTALDPVRAEAARRKALVLGVETPAEVDDAERRMLRKMLQLLRKRETGADYTAQDAAMAAILDELAKAIGEIEDAADALIQGGSGAIGDDCHWPPLTRPS